MNPNPATNPAGSGRSRSRHTTRAAFALLLIAAALAATPARAGRPCDEQPPQLNAVVRGLALAEATNRALQASGAQVVVLARAGQDLTAYGLRWSHLGLAYRDGDAPDSPWRIVHKLNTCGQATSALYRQGLGPFFLDSPWRYEAAFVPLRADVQARLLPLLRDNAALGRLHEPAYSMLAYPQGTRYQQSNQWAIETMALALDEGVTDRSKAQAWLGLRGYTASVLRIGPLTRLGANLTRANVAFDDHPASKRFADRIETVTVDSVFDWLGRSGLGQAQPTKVTE